MTKIYDVDYYLGKYYKIPEDKWQEGGWGEGDVHCAGGHCGVRVGMFSKSQYPKEFLALEDLVGKLTVTQVKYCNGMKYSDLKVIIINDGYAKEYQQLTPKQRILAALRDIKEKLNSDTAVQECDAREAKSELPKPGTKTIIKYVSVPETINESLPETILS